MSAAISLIPSRDPYFDMPGLSASGMKDLEVSPLRYWFKHINPGRPVEEPTPEMIFGSALHCSFLEPAEFDKRYCCEFYPFGSETFLDTVSEMRQWIFEKGGVCKGTRKDEIIAQVLAIDPHQPILQVSKDLHATENAGKHFFKRDDWERLMGAILALGSEPELGAVLRNCDREVVLRRTINGVDLKGKLDIVAPKSTWDIKTFRQTRGKTIDQSIADAIFYEKYYRQMYVYAVLRGWPKEFDGETIMAFVESDPPHEVRLRVLRAKTYTEPNMYWHRGVVETTALIHLYAKCWKEFGDQPWRKNQELDPLIDEEIRQLAY